MIYYQGLPTYRISLIKRVIEMDGFKKLLELMQSPNGLLPWWGVEKWHLMLKALGDVS